MREENRNQRAANPEIGETKEQIRARYGKPRSRTKSGDGEIWTYHINWSRSLTAFAPASPVTGNYGYRPNYCVITFDQQDKVIHWTYVR